MGWPSTWVAAEVVDEGDQRARGQDGGLARPGRLRPAGLRADQAQAHGAGGHGRRQGAGHRRDLAVEVQLADRRPAVQGVLRDDAHGRHQRQRDRQVVVVAFLGQVGRREVGDDPPARQGQAQAGEGRRAPARALSATALSARPTTTKAAWPPVELDLDVDAPGLDALERHRDDPRGHARSPARPRLIHSRARTDADQIKNRKSNMRKSVTCDDVKRRQR